MLPGELKKARIGTQRRHLRKKQRDIQRWIQRQAENIVQAAEQDKRDHANLLVRPLADIDMRAIARYHLDIRAAARATRRLTGSRVSEVKCVHGRSHGQP